MDEERLLLLSALLHDIGKFMQRGCVESKRLYSHPTLSAKLLDPGYSGIKFKENREFLSHLQFLVEHHHEKDLDESNERGFIRVLAEILSEADNISSEEREEEKKNLLPLLRPIFTEISLPGKESVISPYYYAPKKLCFNGEKIGIPANKEFSSQEVEFLYRKHWAEFFEEFKEVIKKSEGILKPDTIFYLLEKYLWCVPSAYFRNNPDISLFEHSKITAAVAISLYRALKNIHPEIFELENVKDIRKIVKDRREKRYLLLGVDVNGIQKFIYSISSKLALKNLKGRSLYIQLLSNLILHIILWDKDIDLYESNIIYSGGGRGYLLLPITVRERIIDLEEEIQKNLFEQFEGRIGVTIGMLELSAEDLLKKKESSRTSIDRTWRRLSEEISKNRWNKLSKLAENNYDVVFGVRQDGGYFNEEGQGDKRVICAICRREIALSDAVDKGDGVQICKECNEFVRIGTKLRADNLFAILTDKTLNGDLVEVKIKNIEPAMYISNFIPEDIKNRALIYSLTDTVIRNSELVDGGYILNAGGKPPEGVNELKDFVSDNREKQKEEGFKRIGILRMDVDNLGKLFKKGFRAEMKTLSRISQLSSSISLFFKGCMKEIASREEFKNDVYIIYSGGDDLFAIGRWNKIPEFAMTVREEFSNYVCHNPSITLSGGIALIKDKYPISRGANLAGMAEEEAKSYRYNHHEKDAIYFLGKALSWKDFKISSGIKDLLVEAMEDKKISRSVLYRLRQIHELHEKESKFLKNEDLSQDDIERRARWSKWMWMLVYNLGRNKNNETLRILGEAILNDKFNGLNGEEPLISYIHVPANWADLLTRR